MEPFGKLRVFDREPKPKRMNLGRAPDFGILLLGRVGGDGFRYAQPILRSETRRNNEIATPDETGLAMTVWDFLP